ncbi:divergent polysaccharide deacetylase family protein [Bacillus coahuilensis]|uniref:divergent polysaccharide deacetylase family protein n=1 Tax=Bacillus coahuilensis TaxID=408580 RepID=UPI0001850EDC|nr:divergent polysaccharide deacetylase family protein [Bacillus coahuilensis]
MKSIFGILLLLFILIVQSDVIVAKETKEFAIVIDDLGNNMKGTEEILQLPTILTVAVMPHLETSKEDAEKAHKLGHEVIIHLPLEPVRGKKSWLGPGSITTDLSDEEIRKRVRLAIKSVPHAVGMNHHLGSKASADERVMRIILEVCKENNLYYLDSKTSTQSVIPKLANELGVSYLENEIFLDHVGTIEHMVGKAKLLEKRLARENELIAIGHVGITGDKMADVLREFIPEFEEIGDAVPLSKLLSEYDTIQGPLNK